MPSSASPKCSMKTSKNDMLDLCDKLQIKAPKQLNKTQLLEMIQKAQAEGGEAENEAESAPPPPADAIELDAYAVGDNLQLMQTLEEGSVHLIYMDPPYNPGRDFHYFQDKFQNFNEFIAARIEKCHRALRDDGTIVIHVEPQISHHIRVICDNVFGPANFRNEIVWHSGGNSKNKYQLGRNHDTLIVYSKSAKYQFFPMYKPYTEDYKQKLKMCPSHTKLYSTSAAHNSQPEVNPRKNLVYKWMGNTRQWYFSLDKMQTLHDDNRLEYNHSNIPRIKRFMDEMDGIPVRDTWDDIASIQTGEKTKYATQKPVALLDRVVRLYTSPGDVCLDPFAGSGTLGRACIALKRRFVLFDINPEAKQVFESSIAPTPSTSSQQKHTKAAATAATTTSSATEAAAAKKKTQNK